MATAQQNTSGSKSGIRSKTRQKGKPAAATSSRGESKPSFASKIAGPQALVERRMLIYGPSGAGKTSFIGSAAFDERTAPILVLDFDGGGSSLAGIDPGLLSYVRVRDWEDYNEAYDYLANSSHPFKTVAIDSLSETHIYSLLNIVDNEVEKRERRIDNLEVEQADYGKALVQMRRFLGAWKVLPMHTIFTAHAKLSVVPREGRVALPNLFGQFAEEVVGMFDVTAYLTVQETTEGKGREKTTEKHRVLTLQNTLGVRAKVRTAYGIVLPQDELIVDDKGITRLFDLMQIPV